MGIKNLWAVLSGSGEMIDLRELQGSSVAIDLAGWIVQNNTCKGMTGTVARPHLRNLFFRTATLINLNIRPVFVLDGNAPDLKKETLEARKRALTQSQDVEVKSLSRSRLKGLMNECKALLDALGIESVKSDGEAESLCAKLNAEGIVDAVISDDSDAFCYGAKVILRNFSISSGNGACVEKYCIDKINQRLHLDRNKLMIMAIFLGCDFCPQGVPGIGKETVLQLFENWPKAWNALGALRFWANKRFQPLKVTKGGSKGAGQKMLLYQCLECSQSQHCEDCDQWSLSVESFAHCHCQLLRENKVVLKLEESIKRKCAELTNFWEDTFEKVVKEFSQKCDQKIIDSLRHFQMDCPKVDDFVRICVKKMAWTEEYALEKILPLITRWQVKNPNHDVVKAVSIIKQRTVSGTPSFSLNWTWLIPKPSLAQDSFETCEPAIYLYDFCPDLISDFEAKKKKPKKAAKAVKKKKNEEVSTQKITEFFKESKTKKVVKKTDTSLSIEAEENDDDGEKLPDNLSFLIDDILSHKFKRNLSIEEPKELMTSTPLGKTVPPKAKKFITPSKVHLENALEDSFDRMCNGKQGFCMK